MTRTQPINMQDWMALVDAVNPHICQLDDLIDLMEEAPIIAELESGYLQGIHLARRQLEEKREPVLITIAGLDLLDMSVDQLESIIQSSVPATKFGLGLVSGVLITKKMHAILTTEFH